MNYTMLHSRFVVLIVLILLPGLYGQELKNEPVQLLRRGLTDEAGNNNGTVDPSGGGNIVNVNSSHIYYTLTVQSNQQNWITRNMSDPRWRQVDGEERTYFGVQLPFPFPFYGHFLRDIYVATGGFISIVPLRTNVTVQSYYISPLMADFTSASAENNIFYFFNDNYFVVQWDGLRLYTNQTHSGVFQFQCILRNTGVIEFFYKTLPVAANDIQEINYNNRGKHPVELGLADAYQRAYLINGEVNIVNYHYSQIDVARMEVLENTLATFHPIPTCNLLTDCESCANHATVFNCHWCESAGLCSDGIDRNRNDYIYYGCEVESNQIFSSAQCTAKDIPVPYTYSFYWPYSTFNCWDSVAARLGVDINKLQSRKTTVGSGGLKVEFETPATEKESNAFQYYLESTAPMECDGNTAQLSQVSVAVVSNSSSSSLSATSLAVIVAAVFIIALVSAAIGWLVYAYRRPNTPSGRWLIAHRNCGVLNLCGCHKKARQESYNMSTQAQHTQSTAHLDVDQEFV